MPGMISARYWYDRLAPYADADTMSHFLPFLIVHPSLPPNQSTVKDHNILLTCQWYEAVPTYH